MSFFFNLKNVVKDTIQMVKMASFVKTQFRSGKRIYTTVQEASISET